MINKKAEELGVEVEVFQNNSQGAIIDRIQQAYFENVDGIVLILELIHITAMLYVMHLHQ